MNTRTQLRLANLLQAISEGEKKIEIVRQVLSEQPNFEPYTAFRRLDQRRNGYLHSYDLQQFLQDNGVYSSDTEVYYLFKFLDFNGDGRISYNDFMKQILPQENQRLKQICLMRDSYFLEIGQQLPYEIEWSLTRIMETEIKNYRQIESLKELLTSSYDFSSMLAFNTIDKERYGYIDYECINRFTKSYQIFLSDEEIIAILRRYGDSACQKIDYSQFLHMIMANKSSNNYAYNAKKLNQNKKQEEIQTYTSPVKSNQLRSYSTPKYGQTNIIEQNKTPSPKQLNMNSSLQFDQKKNFDLQDTIKKNQNLSPEKQSINSDNLDIKNYQNKSDYLIEKSRLLKMEIQQDYENDLKMKKQQNNNLDKGQNNDIEDNNQNMNQKEQENENEQNVEQQQQEIDNNQNDNIQNDQNEMQQNDQPANNFDQEEDFKNNEQQQEQLQEEYENQQQQYQQEIMDQNQQKPTDQQVNYEEQDPENQSPDNFQQNQLENQVNEENQDQQEQLKQNQLLNSDNNNNELEQQQPQENLQDECYNNEQQQAQLKENEYQEDQQQAQPQNQEENLNSGEKQQLQDIQEVQEQVNESDINQQQADNQQNEQKPIQINQQNSGSFQSNQTASFKQLDEKVKPDYNYKYNQYKYDYLKPKTDSIKAYSYTQILKQLDQDYFVQFLVNYIKLEKQANEIRKHLALRQDFNLLDAYRTIDINAQGFVTFYDLQLALKQMKIYPQIDNLKLFFNNLCIYGNNKMKYSDFAACLIPLEQSYAEVMKNRTHNIMLEQQGFEAFDYLTQSKYKQLLTKLIDNEGEQEVLRRCLCRRSNFSVSTALSLLDKNNKNYCVREDFKKLLQNNNLYFSDDDIQGLVRKFTKESSQIITYKDLLKELNPKKIYNIYN